MHLRPPVQLPRCCASLTALLASCVCSNVQHCVLFPCSANFLLFVACQRPSAVLVCLLLYWACERVSHSAVCCYLNSPSMCVGRAALFVHVGTGYLCNIVCHESFQQRQQNWPINLSSGLTTVTSGPQPRLCSPTAVNPTLFATLPQVISAN